MPMEVRSISRNVPMSPQKMREMVRQIQGLNAVQAQAILAVVPRKSARLVLKTLQSALANAENNQGLKPEGLRIKAAVTGAATSHKRFVPKARGSAGPGRRQRGQAVGTDERMPADRPAIDGRIGAQVTGVGEGLPVEPSRHDHGDEGSGWSGRWDSNPRSRAPKARALADYATPRRSVLTNPHIRGSRACRQ